MLRRPSSKLGRNHAGVGIILSAVLALAASSPAAAAALPYYDLEKVYCIDDMTGFPNSILIPAPVIYAMDYQPGVVDYQWVTWRVWLYQQVGTSWEPVNAQNPSWGQWQPTRKVFDRDNTSGYISSANGATLGIPVARGAAYRIAYQVYWYKSGTGSTVPVAHYGAWTWATAHMNISGGGWIQYAPDACYYRTVTGVIDLSGLGPTR